MMRMNAGAVSTAGHDAAGGRVDQNDRLAPMLDDLAAMMRELIELYETLNAAAEQRVEALKHADTSALAAVIAEENAAVQRVAQLEQTRMRVVGQLAAAMGSEAKAQTTMTWIAERAGAERGETLSRMARTLRSLMTSLRETNAAAKQAAELLAQHMEGLMRAVAQRLNHAQTYGKHGRVDAGPVVLSGVDVSS